ncbi:MAG: hypothetical protein PVF58_09905 [Candidatus Methanofastidiosia archaeon]|jgi:hypothetical protein
MKKIIVAAVIMGLVITVITGFINTTPPGWLGAIWYGWPLVWKTVPVVPNPEPHYRIAHFVGDFVFWSVIAGIVLGVGWKLTSKK